MISIGEEFSYFLPLFDRPKINIVFSNTLKARSCIAKQVHNSTRNIFKKDIRRLSNTDDKRNQIRWF